MKNFFGLLTLAAVLMSGSICSASNDPFQLQEFKTQIINDFEISDPLDLPGDRAAALYNIDPADIEESASFITMDGTFPDEIVMIKAVDDEAAKKVEEQLSARLDEVIQQSQNYDAESYALLKKCKLQKSNHIIAIFISAKGAEMQSAFEKAVK